VEIEEEFDDMFYQLTPTVSINFDSATSIETYVALQPY